MSEAKRNWARDVQKARPSPHGRAVGSAMAKLADKQEAALKAAGVPDVPERCSTCAFRHGTQANGYANTQLEALRCVVGADKAPFGCHHTLDNDAKPTELCAGYLVCRTAEFGDVMAAVEDLHAQLAALEP